MRTAHDSCSTLPLDPNSFVAALAREALAHRAVHHPYLAALAAGDVPDLRWAMADFARQYSGYSIHFRSYLSRVITRLDNPHHRASLRENLAEESGTYEPAELATLASLGIAAEWIVGVPHPELFQRFRAALDVEPHMPDHEAPEVRCWRELFLELLEGSCPATAIGALGLGTENIVRTIYTPFTKALAQLPELSLRDTVFFPLHTAVDDDHAVTLHAIALDLASTPEGRRGLRHGMLGALELRACFWDWMYARALAR